MITHYLQNSVVSSIRHEILTEHSLFSVNSDFTLYKRIVNNKNSLVSFFSFAESFTMKLIFLCVMLVFAIDRAYGDCSDGKILK